MTGKYLGFVLPVLFGTYGAITLFGDHTRALAVRYILQMVVILYPPFVVFNVGHARYLRNNGEVLLGRLEAVRGNVFLDAKPANPPGIKENERP